jgi:hypothetical protein
MYAYALHCFHPFTSARAFADHFPDCSKHVYQRMTYPEPQSDESIVMMEIERENRARAFLSFMRDFESCLFPVHDDSGVLDEHVPSGFRAYTVSTDPEFETEPVTYSGRNCMTVFYDNIGNKQHRIAVYCGKSPRNVAFGPRRAGTFSIKRGHMPRVINCFLIYIRKSSTTT